MFRLRFGLSDHLKTLRDFVFGSRRRVKKVRIFRAWFSHMIKNIDQWWWDEANFADETDDTEFEYVKEEVAKSKVMVGRGVKTVKTEKGRMMNASSVNQSKMEQPEQPQLPPKPPLPPSPRSMPCVLPPPPPPPKMAFPILATPATPAPSSKPMMSVMHKKLKPKPIPAAFAVVAKAKPKAKAHHVPIVVKPRKDFKKAQEVKTDKIDKVDKEDKSDKHIQQ